MRRPRKFIGFTLAEWRHLAESAELRASGYTEDSAERAEQLRIAAFARQCIETATERWRPMNYLSPEVKAAGNRDRG